MNTAEIRTKFLVISDTHGIENLPPSALPKYADVAIHCGDLTQQSKLHEYKASIRLLQAVNAPLKLVIAGNHDYTMDVPVFKRRIEEAHMRVDPKLVEQTFGYFGEARQLFDETTGITFLDEGTHSFRLRNGALLKVFASPHTPSLGAWGFQYNRALGHTFDIHNVDIAITHGPPKGVMDTTRAGDQAGCPDLFEAIARARPQMHCFGHIHEAWGAKLVTWCQQVTEKPSHLTDIDDAKSVLIAELPPLKREADKEPVKWAATSHCSGDPNPLGVGSQTLCVNAAIRGTPWNPVQPPWVIDLELPTAH